MATIEWNTIPFELQTDLGTLTFNEFPGLFLLEDQCKASRRIRATSDDIPQGDGEIFHTRYTGGYEMRLVCQAWHNEDEMMCSGQFELVEIRDELYGHLWSLLRPETQEERLIWTPTGHGSRILNAIRLLNIEDPVIGDQGQVTFDFTIDSPFPYAISLAEPTPNLNGTATLPNGGNVDFYPVFKVNGATSAFTITNDDTGLAYVYDSSRPGGASIGGGHYAEIDMFRGGLIYLDGDQANLKPGVDPVQSDILYVQPGGNQFTITGADADVLLHDAWA